MFFHFCFLLYYIDFYIANAKKGLLNIISNIAQTIIISFGALHFHFCCLTITLITTFIQIYLKIK